jgi:alpha-glucosidase
MQRRLHDANRPDNLPILDVIRRRVDAFDDRFVFGEFSEEPEIAGAYAAPDEGLHAGYTFNMLLARKRSPTFVKKNLQVLDQYPDHWPCVSFSNHDVPRTATRFGEGSAKLMFALLATLKGTVLMYQGEELGLPDGDLRRDQLRDPVGDLYYPDNKGRDGCRTPMPWDEGLNHGFSNGTPWLPAVPEHDGLSVASQLADPASNLAFARKILALRKAHPALVTGALQEMTAPSGVLAYQRVGAGEALLCVFNLSDDPVTLDAPGLSGGETLLTGGEVSLHSGVVTLGPLSLRLSRL